MKRVTAALALVAATVPLPAGAASGVELTLASRTGRGETSAVPSCRQGSAEALHYRFAGRATGAPAPLASAFELELGIHRELPGDGFMLPSENYLTLLTPRGEVYARLDAGTCSNPALTATGSEASGAGAWTITGGGGSLVGISGGGSFRIWTNVGPAPDAQLDLELSGAVSVAQPAPYVDVDRVLWADLIDYANRVVTVVYRVTNPGPGEAFSVRLRTGPNLPGSVQSLSAPGANVGTLAAGSGADVAMRYRLDAGHCPLPAGGCSFSPSLHALFADALAAPLQWGPQSWPITVPPFPA